ncbi:hypothetical protein ACHAXT_008919 [Thalassiosira profunda]
MATLLLSPRSLAFGTGLRGLAIRNLVVLRGGCRDIRAHSSVSTRDASNIPLPSSFDERREDVHAAITAVLAACRVTRLVQPTSNTAIDTISKQDSSPVTVGDFSSQAVALQILHAKHPHDMYIAEEGSEALRNDDGLLNSVCRAVEQVQNGVEKEQLMRAIDYGQGIDDENDAQQLTGRRRVWCLDPIDGTKGFLRGRIEGGQYCIALALLEEGEPVVSVLGCPNLPLPSTPATKTVPYGRWSEEEEADAGENPNTLFSGTRGCLFVAVRGCGCYEVPLQLLEEAINGDGAMDPAKLWTRLKVTPNDGSKLPSQARFCLGVERGFSDPKGTVLQIAQAIHGPEALTTDSDGIQDIKRSLRMDGQGKYGLLARGDAECFLRLPKDGYVDWVWDVAAGYLILKEAGGTMTDVRGKEIDFSQIGVERSAKLPDDVKGILGSAGGVFHDALLDAYAQAE